MSRLPSVSTSDNTHRVLPGLTTWLQSRRNTLFTTGLQQLLAVLRNCYEALRFDQKVHT